MNYLFGSMQREFEYKDVKPKQDKLDVIEEISDALVELEETLNIKELDYNVFRDACEIIVICDELVVRSTEERLLYEVLEKSDRFTCKQANRDPATEDCMISLTLKINF